MKEFMLIISPLAEVDMEAARDWYEIQKENLGNEFIDAISRIVIRIRENPYQYFQTQKNIRKAIVTQFPYSVFFTIQGQTIIVFAVFHNSRNPITWKGRLK